MNKLTHFGAVLSVLSLGLFACSQDAAPAAAGQDGLSSGNSGGAPGESGVATSGTGANDSAPTSSCFGEPRPATGMCPAVFVTNELAEPVHLIIHKGVAYVGQSRSVVTVDLSTNAIAPYQAGRIVAIDNNDRLFFETKDGLMVSPLAHPNESRLVSTRSAVSIAALNGHVAFTQSAADYRSATLQHADLTKSTPAEILVNEVAGTDSDIAMDDSFVYFFAWPNLGTAEVRRVPISGGASKRVAYQPGSANGAYGADMTLTKDTVFFTVDGWLKAAQKAEGNAPRSVFGARVSDITSDGDHLYFASRADDHTLTFYRAASDGTKIVPIGQQPSASGVQDLAVDAEALYAIELNGSLVKVPKN